MEIKKISVIGADTVGKGIVQLAAQNTHQNDL